MTVAELIDQLSEMPPDALVVVSSDSEGNHFSPLDPDVTQGDYRPESKWSGSVYKTTRGVVMNDAVDCVALWPLN